MSAPRPVLPLEFHVSRAVRDRARFDETLFASSGHVVLARPAAAHRFAAALDAARGGPPRASAADLFAMGLLDEAMHAIVARWLATQAPRALGDALTRLAHALGPARLDSTLLAFTESFPPVAVYQRAVAAQDWLQSASAGRAHREAGLEEMLLLALANENPAYAPYHDLFDDAPLAAGSAYRTAVRELETLLGSLPGPAGPGGESLLEVLRAPMRAEPHSIAAQLRFARGAWAPWIGDLLERMELAFDLRREEEHWLASRDALHGEPTGPLGAAPDYTGLAHEDERFSDDAEWMPRTVMIAKSTLVWLDQLARRHGRAITRLDQVPDEELARLAAFGINALWLIGVWERSAASRLIKRLAGNPDAAASAYALHDYSIAEELGGEDAWRGLRDRAAAHGIRLASDMVPNHVGIDSPWVTEHPEWFLQREDCPYPSYRFEGHELSSDPRVSIRIEDHYWDRSDAAVVFRHIDHRSGRRRFLYHGNDGTSFPWNDTAQIDYLNPAAREAVMQAILSVARRFPIIRFDAAMTLAKRHIQRLWFPPPGEGGAIPSRAGLGPTREEFDRLMPREFWREVVDRVAVEAPGTLLLAEAFWLMEGYFVRTLGMHRVYNSAFMVMLRDERNADFRRVLRDTLEFDPGILQRWVNFLNNPDERTAVDQFGRGEKYFGACTLLATLPGLPMFGHGQVEGHEERYGMEFRRALRDEPVDEGLEREHWRRIVPLLHRRSMFAGAVNFRLYDCIDHGGSVNEDVFAFSNRDAHGAAIVLHHNRWARTAGRVRVSVAYAEKRDDGTRPLVRDTLLSALGFGHLPHDALLRCHEVVSGHAHLFRVGELREQGLRVELDEFASRVFMDWSEVVRDGRPWDELERRLEGRGVPDLESALWDLVVEPLQTTVTTAVRGALEDSAETALGRALGELLEGALPRLGLDAGERAVTRMRLLQRQRALAEIERASGAFAPAERAAHRAWLLLEAAGHELDARGAAGTRLFDELRLRGALAEGLRSHGAADELAWRLAARVRALLAHPHAGDEAPAGQAWDAFVRDTDAAFAAGIAPGATPASAGSPPAWVSLPGRLGS